MIGNPRWRPPSLKGVRWVREAVVVPYAEALEVVDVVPSAGEIHRVARSLGARAAFAIILDGVARARDARVRGPWREHFGVLAEVQRLIEVSLEPCDAAETRDALGC